MAEFVPDPRQKQAIEHINGPMLVVAGAGTGKTTVLVKRIVHLIAEGEARPDQILAVTYTRNSAAELKARVNNEISLRLGPKQAKEAESLQASTFHAYCNEVLKRAGQDFTPLSRQDLYVLLRRRLKELGLNYYIKAARPGQFLDALLAFFDRCDDELVTPQRYAQYLEELKAGKHPLPRVLKAKDAGKLSRDEVIARCEEIAGVFTKVVELLRENNLGTFGHQISRAVRLLQSDPQMLIAEQKRALFILIDEFQDSNVAQIKLARLLAGDEQNVFAVGDPDQAIYRFRGATTGAFDHFQRQFKDVKYVVLNRNRRSLSPILRCAFRVINENPPIVQAGSLTRQPLVSAREEEAHGKQQDLKPEPVEVVITPSQYSNDTEAAEIVDTIDGIHRSYPSCEWSHIAILYRQHRHREELIRELSRREIPFAVRGINILGTPEVRDALAGIRAIANLGDSVALFRLAALPLFEIDAAEFRQALRAAEEHATMISVLQKVKGGAKLVETLARSRALAEQASYVAVAALEIALKQLKIAMTPATRALREFVHEWAGKPLTETGNLEEFLEYLGYFAEAGGGITLPDFETERRSDQVQLMSVHSAKGLEFPHVFVIRATSTSFPSTYREDLFEFPQALRDQFTAFDADAKAIHEQEERRLFYVALTRARDMLAIYARCGRGRKDPTPPGFLREVLNDKTLADVVNKREAEFRPEIAAAAGQVQAFSSVAEWMLLPPSRALERISLSATRIETYTDCPLRFKIETEWNIPSEPVPAMQFGNAVHTTLRGYYDAVRARRPLSREVFLGSFVEAMKAMRFEDEHQKELYLEQGAKQLGQFYDLRNTELLPDVVATEKFFEISVGGIRVVGRIDRTDRMAGGGIAIIDYKTGAARTEEDADSSLQLSIYALAAQREWNLLPERIAFYNLETNSAVNTFRTAEELEETKRKIDEVAASIRAGKFEPKPGFHCGYCGYRELCPVQEEPLYTMAEAILAKAAQ